MSNSKYHETEKVLVKTKDGKQVLVKRTSVSFKPIEKVTLVGPMIITHDVAYAKEKDGHLRRLNKNKPGKAARRAAKRERNLERYGTHEG